MHIELPKGVAAVINGLCASGYAAYIVGGCVRDALLGRAPQDFDVATSAHPEVVKTLLPTYRSVDTGIRHGTVTLLTETGPVEVTTFRVDGGYSDGRHPDQVAFTDDITADLSRRDLTINAIAYHPSIGLIDPWGGQEDIKRQIIRTVGSPHLRFAEDGLRILRALRFASTLSFQIEDGTAMAILESYERLGLVAMERLSRELLLLLCGGGIHPILQRFAPVFTFLFPALRPAVGFPQNSPYHYLDVYEHTALAVSLSPPDPVIRLALLLHDVGKPLVHQRGTDGVDHFYSHEKQSAQLAKAACQRLRLDHVTADAVVCLVGHHHLPMAPESPLVKRRLNQLGPSLFFQLLEVKRADCRAQAPSVQYRLAELAAVEALAKKLLDERACFSLKDLAVGGNDLLSLGLPSGPALGKALKALLQLVMDEELPNEREALLTYCEAKFL